jgi:hypothetical protein
VYDNVIEALPPHQPVPRGKLMRTTNYQEAKLYHDLCSGIAMSCIIHFVNETAVISFWKKKQTVEMASYGSEFLVAIQAAQQIIYLCYTPPILVIFQDDCSWMFAKDECVIPLLPILIQLLTSATKLCLTIVSVIALQQSSFSYTMLLVT